MEKRRLGTSDLELTVIGLGTWAMGGDGWDYGWGPQAEADSVEAVLEALSLGVNWIDTAPAYGFGRAETAVGLALKKWGKPVIVATKCGRLSDGKGHLVPCLEPASIFKEAENSLRRLQVDVIDLYQIHWPDPAKDIERAWEAVLTLREKGRIRYAGVSNFSAEQLETLSRIEPPVSLQPPYSLLKRGIEDGVLPWCRAHQTGVVAYSPMQNGILTDKFSREWAESLAPSDWRKERSPFLREPGLSVVVKQIEALRQVASARGCGLAELAVNWVIQQPGVTAAIAGARKKGQMRDVLKCTGWTLSPAELEAAGKAVSGRNA